MFSREGLTLDVVAGAVRNWILTPTTTLPLALGLTWEPLFARLAQRSSRDRAAAIRSRVYWLAAASLALALNDQLNKQSANNWVVDSRWNWDDEIVVVTGGSSGIGASICQKLVARNPRTRIVVLDYVPLSWTPPPGARLHFYECDLSDAYAIKLVCDRVKAEVGHPTVLFNNAGLARGSTVMEGTSNDVQLTIKTNLIAPFLLVREFLPEMVRRDHGHILNTGSLSSVVSAPTIVDYSASKAGLTALHEGLQLELKSLHKAPRVRLTLGIFSFIRTPLFTGKTNESNFVAPLLNVETVSDKLVDAAYGGYGGTIYLPGICRYITSLKGGPEWLFRRVRERSLRGDYDFERQKSRYDQETGKRIVPALDPLK
ncbi:Dehydrogenase RED2 [Metarhizium anisopliae]|nr:Dehydrogenase RED2 [Metarhizium anisopliae]